MTHDFNTGLLEKQAQEEAKKGMANYSRWWHSSAITPAERDYLIKGGFQENLKADANAADGKSGNG